MARAAGQQVRRRQPRIEIELLPSDAFSTEYGLLFGKGIASGRRYSAFICSSVRTGCFGEFADAELLLSEPASAASPIALTPITKETVRNAIVCMAAQPSDDVGQIY